MSVYCELGDVVQQIRYKTQIFYETFKRDSIAEQIYNFSNESSSEIDPDIPFSKSLEKDYSQLYKPITTPNSNTPSGISTPPTITLSPPPPQQQQAQAQQVQKPTTATTAATVVTNTTPQQPSPNNNTTSCSSSGSSSGSSNNNTGTTTSGTTITSTNTSTVTSATNSTISSLTSTDTSVSSTNQQAPVATKNPTTNPTTTTTTTTTTTPQPIAVQPNTTNTTNTTQTSTSPKKCKIVTFSGTSVKLNKTLPTKSDNKQQQPDTSKTQQSISTTTIPAPDNQPIFVFVKEKVKKLGESSSNIHTSSSASLLTRLVKPNNDDSDYGDIVPPPGMGLTLLIHTVVGQLKVRVIEKATIFQTIAAVLKIHQHSGNSGSGGSLIQDPKAYNLRIADNNGKTDLDFPPLDPTQLINKFKDEVLVLVTNPKFDLKKSSSSLSISGGIQPPQNNSVNSNNSSNNSNNNNNSNLKSSTGIQQQSQQQQPQQAQQAQQSQQPQAQQPIQHQLSHQQLQPDQVGGGGGGFHRTHNRNVSSGPDAPLVIKITLPDSSITKVVFQKTMLLKDLLETTCKKRKLLISDHFFTLENGATCNGALPMEKLGGADLILVSKRPTEPITALSPTDSEGSASDLQQDIFWYDALAWQYKTYEVTKTKKYGPKQDRIIGIDKERVTNMSPKETETKRPARLIKDISKVSLLEKPKYFTIEYNDGKSYIYEAKTTSLANEIVGKISYILGKY